MVRKSINNILFLWPPRPATSQQHKNGQLVIMVCACILSILTWLMDALMYERGAGGGSTFPISPGNFTLADLVSE